MAEERYTVEWTDERGRVTFVMLVLESFDKNFKKYKLKVSLFIFISKELWKNEKSDKLVFGYIHCHLFCAFNVAYPETQFPNL